MSTASKGWGGKDGPPVLTVRKPLVNKDRDWVSEAECRKPQYQDIQFFVSMEQKEEVARAKDVCKRCPVLVDCLKFAVDNDIQFGIWGGTTPSERNELARSSDD